MLLTNINENELSEKDINNILFNIPKDDGIDTEKSFIVICL